MRLDPRFGYVPRKDGLGRGVMAKSFVYASNEVGETACLIVSYDGGGEGAGGFSVRDLGAKTGVDGWMLDDVVNEGGDKGRDAFKSGRHENDSFGADSFGGKRLRRWGIREVYPA